MLDSPFTATPVVLIALGSACLAVIVLLVSLGARFRRMARGARGRQGRRTSVGQNVMRFLLIIIWILSSLVVLFIAAFAQSFSAFTKQELVAEVKCHLVNEEPHTMLLTLTRFENGEEKPPEGFVLKGDQWALEGDIVKWDDWLNFAGLHTMFKLTRVRGRFQKTVDEVAMTPTAYSLIEHEERPEWRWLYQNGYRLRFIDAVYGNTVYTYPDSNRTFQVYVTTSGFLVRKKAG